ncbi:MAG: hypothetical protein PHR21_05895 [Oscillospiraceae bacterium]|nr:hypothetical protein [Oscillospiraceae bacterium]MDD4368109.1 hypothetical protein [Oscillospiraceae bacterium]
MAKITTFVGGRRCVLQSDASALYMEKICRLADQKIRQIKARQNGLGDDQIYLLALINELDQQQRERLEAGAQAGPTPQVAALTAENQLLKEKLTAYEARACLAEAFMQEYSGSNTRPKRKRSRKGGSPKARAKQTESRQEVALNSAAAVTDSDSGDPEHGQPYQLTFEDYLGERKN